MRFLLILAVSLGLTPAPVDFSPREGTCVSPGKVIVKTGAAGLRKATAFLPEFAFKEAYRISISKRKIVIEANTAEGEFRARKSLEQLSLSGPIPCGVIFDYPRLEHRGLMIDESRSFKGLDFLKKQVDAMALLKLNVLHLHLDDSAGWRIESERFPLLTEKTAFRSGATYHEWEAGKYKFSSKEDPEAYGGYYTKAELRELVEYAAERFVTVIPEIEMPGHSMEVGYAYPDVLCTLEDGTLCRGAWDLCPGSEATYSLLEGVLKEVMDIFPSKLVHIGGDEATMKTWPGCPRCRSLMEREGYTSVKELQGYLVRRIEAYLRSHGRRIIGWDEILDGDLSKDAVAQSWRGTEGGVKASKRGNDYIMSPNTHCYLNYYQDLIRKEPKAVGELVSLRFCYGYEPLGEGMDPGHLLGMQANLWTELIQTPSHAEYMLYPRLFAIAETAWSLPGRKDWEDFRTRAGSLTLAFRSLGYNTFDLETESELARSGFQRFEQLEKYKANETLH